MNEEAKEWKYVGADGKEEAVKLEAWGWCAAYRDGSELRQFGSDGTFHRFAEIKQDEMEGLIMYRTDDPKKRYDLFLKPGQQAFHYYKNFVFKALTEEEVRARVYAFGWKDRTTGLTSYHYILPSGNLVTGADMQIEELSRIVVADLAGMTA